jgi:hypothetical protein
MTANQFAFDDIIISLLFWVFSLFRLFDYIFNVSAEDVKSEALIWFF